MTASEKLEALDGVIESESQRGRTERAEAAEPFIRALPQIIAVVKAAEAMPPMEVGTPYVYARSDECGELHAALAALDEALNNLDGRKV